MDARGLERGSMTGPRTMAGKLQLIEDMAKAGVTIGGVPVVVDPRVRPGEGWMIEDKAVNGAPNIFVSPKTWADLNNDLNCLREMDMPKIKPPTLYPFAGLNPCGTYPSEGPVKKARKRTPRQEIKFQTSRADAAELREKDLDNKLRHARQQRDAFEGETRRLLTIVDNLSVALRNSAGGGA